MEKQYFELVDLAARIKEGVAELFPEKIWVKGEIREWSPRSNGHCYLTLSQSLSGKPLAEMRAMIWKWHYPAVKTFFEEASGETLRAGITVLGTGVTVDKDRRIGGGLMLNAEQLAALN